MGAHESLGLRMISASKTDRNWAVKAARDRRRATLEAAARDVADILSRIDADECGVTAAPHLDYAFQLLREEIRSLAAQRRRDQAGSLP